MCVRYGSRTWRDVHLSRNHPKFVTLENQFRLVRQSSFLTFSLPFSLSDSDYNHTSQNSFKKIFTFLSSFSLFGFLYGNIQSHQQISQVIRQRVITVHCETFFLTVPVFLQSEFRPLDRKSGKPGKLEYVQFVFSSFLDSQESYVSEDICSKIK